MIKGIIYLKPIKPTCLGILTMISLYKCLKKGRLFGNKVGVRTRGTLGDIDIDPLNKVPFRRAKTRAKKAMEKDATAAAAMLCKTGFRV